MGFDRDGQDGREQRREAYRLLPHDPVRDIFERELFAELIPALLEEAGGGRLLDLGCADGMAAELAGDRLERYLGVDLSPPAVAPRRGEFLAHDLREGLGPVGSRPYDFYLASFGVASHLRPGELLTLLGAVASHGRTGSIVALEALGAYSWSGPSSGAPTRAPSASCPTGSEATWRCTPGPRTSSSGPSTTPASSRSARWTARSRPVRRRVRAATGPSCPTCARA
ncbi:MAG: hypothetical protein WKF31_03795 [Thermoleophilaceae bacterium]